MTANMFQRRHFDFLAQTIAEIGCLTDFQRRDVALELGLRLKATNSRFSVDRFVAACVPVAQDATPEPVTASTLSSGLAESHECGYCTDTATYRHGGSDSVPALYVCTRHYLDCDTPL